MQILQRTWPAGTEITAEVLDVTAGTHPRRPLVTTLKDADGEGHIIVNAWHDIPPRVGQRVRMRFKVGQFQSGWRIIGLVDTRGADNAGK